MKKNLRLSLRHGCRYNQLLSFYYLKLTPGKTTSTVDVYSRTWLSGLRPAKLRTAVAVIRVNRRVGGAGARMHSFCSFTPSRLAGSCSHYLIPRKSASKRARIEWAQQGRRWSVLTRAVRTVDLALRRRLDECWILTALRDRCATASVRDDSSSCLV